MTGEKIDTLEITDIENFVLQRTPVSKEKDNPHNVEKMIADHISDERLVCKI